MGLDGGYGDGPQNNAPAVFQKRAGGKKVGISKILVVQIIFYFQIIKF